MHPIIVQTLVRQRHEMFDREVAKAALVAEARAYREQERAAREVEQPAVHRPSWARLMAELLHPRTPHGRAR